MANFDGTASDDQFTGSADADQMSGYGGSDTLVGAGGDDLLYGGADFDNLYGGDGDDVIYGGSGGIISGYEDDIYGGDGNDRLYGDDGDDHVYGGAGNDTLFITLADTMPDSIVDGGTDTDTLVVSNNGAVSNFTMSSAGSVGGFVFANMEALTWLGDNSTNETVTGGDFNDTLLGRGGNDVLAGGGGVNTLSGGTGDDMLVATSGSNTLSGGSGDDTFVLDGGSVIIEDFQGHDTIDARSSATDDYIDLSGVTSSRIENQTCIIAERGHTSQTVDVQFLQDLTGSFSDDLANLKALLPQIVDAVREVQANSALGVSTFVDKPLAPFGFPGEWPYATKSALTTDANVVISAYRELSTLLGKDNPESQLEALMQVALRQTEVGYRPDSARFVILFTDAPFHVAGDGAAAGILTSNNGDAVLDGTPAGSGEDYPTIAQVKAALEGADIIPIFAIANGYEASYQTLAAQLGRGVVVSLSSDSANVVQAVTDGLASATTTVIEDAKGGSGNDTILGNAVANMLEGNAGNDTLDGRQGNDHLFGGSDNDMVFGGIGNDAVFGGEGSDLLDGGAGADAMTGGKGDDMFIVDNSQDQTTENLGEGLDTVKASITWALARNVENLTLTGSASLDGTGNDANNLVIGNDAANNLTGNGGNDRLVGKGGDDRLFGGFGNDTLDGGDGQDVLQGGSNNDILWGGPGDDTFVFGEATTASGFDKVEGSSGNDTIRAGVDQAVIGLTTVAGVETITADGHAGVRILGNAAAQNWDFSSTTLNGIANIDAGAGDDLVTGSDVADTIFGRAGRDTLTGGGGADRIFGGLDADQLYGGSGVDRIVGGPDADQLFGGSGADRFTYWTTADSTVTAVDFIFDFSQLENDRIDLSGIDANSTLASDQAFTWIADASFTQVAGELREVVSASSTSILGDVNGDGIADFRIDVAGGLHLTPADFFL